MGTKQRQITKAMSRAMLKVGVTDPCQLGGLQVLHSDTMTDCRIIDPGQGKYGQSQAELRPWFDKVAGYQRMGTKGAKSKNRSGNPRIDNKHGKTCRTGPDASRGRTIRRHTPGTPAQ